MTRVTAMSAERWERVKDVLSAALEHPDSARAHFVAQACAGDALLQSEVESLLAFDHSLGDFLSQPIVTLADHPEPDRPAIQPGERIGRYRVISTLGVGGMGEVYLADDPGLDRKVAVKVLRVQSRDGTEHLRRFILEARAASRLSHPNIATVYEIGVHADGYPFIAMEYVNGSSLRERLRNGARSIGESIDIALQVTAGLAAAHEAGVVHRDVKPENVMVREDRLVKLVDFGIAKHNLGPRVSAEPNADCTDVTDSGSFVGTLRYMSPEQANGGPVDVRTDVWAVGALLYELITGSPPSDGPTTSNRPDDHQDWERAIAVPLRAVAPPTLTHVITKALRQNRNERHSTMAALATELREFQTSIAEQQRGAGHVTPLLPRRDRKRTSTRVRGWSSAALLLLVAALLVAVWKRWNTHPAGLLEHALASRIATLEARDRSNRGRVVIESPINHTWRPDLDYLATEIVSTMERRTREERVAHVVPRDSVTAIERTMAATLGSNTAVQRLQRANAFIAVSTIYRLDGDSLQILLTVQRRTKPSRRVAELRTRLANMSGSGARAVPVLQDSLEGLEMWRLGFVNASLANPSVAVSTLARRLTRALDSMRSCTVESHESPESVPWCWRSENEPEVVRGFWSNHTSTRTAADYARLRRPILVP